MARKNFAEKKLLPKFMSDKYFGKINIKFEIRIKQCLP